MNRKRRRSATARRPVPPADDLADAEHWIALGLSQHQRGQLVEAEQCYRTAIELAPNSVTAAHLLARVYHQQDRFAESLRWMQHAVDGEPQNAKALNDLGNLLDEMERSDDALDAYRTAVELEPTNATIRNNLCRLLVKLGRAEAAKGEYREAIAQHPDEPSNYRGLASVYKHQGQLKEAAQIYRQAIAVKPNDPDSYRQLCSVLARLSDLENAAEVCRAWLEYEPEHPVATHMLAAYAGDRGVPHASNAYLEAVFDEFADSFDAELAALGYQVPQRIGEKLDELYGSPTAERVVLDAGCGTGLCGPLLRKYARRLEGVDLSHGMLQRAERRGVYDRLAHAELGAYLTDHRDTYDLVVAADTLIYFGQLDLIFPSVLAALRPWGRFLFTLEASEHHDHYQLEQHGRYTHSPEYVITGLREAGFGGVCCQPIVVREQAAIPVSGLLVLGIREPNVTTERRPIGNVK